MKTRQDVIRWAKNVIDDNHGGLDYRWEQIARMFRPNAIGYNTELTAGADRESEVYDSLPIDQADRMARNLFAWIMNPATRWFTFEWDDEDLKDSKEAKDWLEQCVKIHASNLNNSNWSMKALQVIFDMVTTGTAMPQVDEKPSMYDEDSGEFRGFHFQAHHMSVSFGEESADDTVRNTVVSYKYNARQAAEKYGEDNLPQRVLTALSQNSLEKFEFVHVIVLRRLEREPDNDVMLPENKRPYWSIHFERSSGKVVRETGYYEQTRSMPRYATTNDSDYGYSPAMKALPDARVLNEAQQKELDAWDKALEPPIQADPDKLKNGEVHQEARGVTLVDDINSALGEMPGTPNYQAHLINVKDKRQSIRDIFLGDVLDLPDRERVGQMTAYEIQKRVERILRSAGSVVTSIHTEFLQIILFASFMMLLRRGVFPAVPEIVAQKGGKNVLKLTLLGPLAKAQRGEDAEVIRAAVLDVVGLARQMPDPERATELLDIVDFDEAIRMAFDSQGVPQKILRDKDKVEIIREDRRKRIEEAGASGAEGAAGQAVPGPVAA
ncbi:MAG: portal protein [Myxococcota bacterium]|nr:portal protein [Myxococcota bacterium]